MACEVILLPVFCNGTLRYVQRSDRVITSALPVAVDSLLALRGVFGIRFSMAGEHDIRWKQRFQPFSRACVLLREGVERGADVLSPLETEGVVQRFEYTLELAWKTAKDFLEAAGAVITPVTPRQVLKDAFAAKILVDGHVWIAMLDHRNLLSHTCDQAVFSEAGEAITTRYLLALHGDIDALGAEAIAAALDELPLPYHYDVKSYAAITLPALREHIDRVGIAIYTRET